MKTRGVCLDQAEFTRICDASKPDTDSSQNNWRQIDKIYNKLYISLQHAPLL